MFVVDTFYGSLPEKYVDFKNLLRDLFPQVYDGKVMATTLSKNEVRIRRADSWLAIF